MECPTGAHILQWAHYDAVRRGGVHPIALGREQTIPHLSQTPLSNVCYSFKSRHKNAPISEGGRIFPGIGRT
jgi:hypothetical protein